MSNNRLSSRALGVILCLPLAAMLGCASKSAGDTSVAPAPRAGDPTMRNNEGKSLEDLLNRFPGVLITQANGGGLQFRIRGGGSTFMGDEGPLLVLNESPQPSDAHGVLFLNPYEIEKVEVLKNPADIGVYGVRGANGIIKITTKKPPRR